MFMDANNILESWLLIHVYPKDGKQKLFTYVVKMDNSKELLEGQKFTYIF